MVERIGPRVGPARRRSNLDALRGKCLCGGLFSALFQPADKPGPRAQSRAAATSAVAVLPP